MTPSMDTQSASPWLSVWFRPGRAIQHIVAVNQHRHLWLLAGLAGIGGLVFQLLSSEWRAVLLDWRWVAVIALGGAALGIVGLYVSGFFFRWSGKLFGGQAAPADVRAAVAWSPLPTILGATICLAAFVAMNLSGHAKSRSGMATTN
jgi:hypothetical protein